MQRGDGGVSVFAYVVGRVAPEVMNGKNHQATYESGAGSGSDDDPTHSKGPGRPKAASWLNWVLAILTVPGAAIVMLFALGAVMSTDSCTDRTCPNLGAGIDFGVLFYGAPVVALCVIVISFFTARRRGGIAVPLCGWALLLADVAILALTVAR